MKASIQILISIVFITLSACSTQEVKQDVKAIPAPDKAPVITEGSAQMSGQNPPLTWTKGNTTLNLVRIMDGGVCKNDFQGVKGAFLLYADPTDIERIKREKGPQIFGDFENKIQTLATEALQEAINATNLAEDPFALGADEAQEKLTKQLSINFRNSVANPIKLFQKETTLTIDVVPFAPSFTFYQQGCEATHPEPEN
ncbi:MAG: hypothetical protein ACXV8Q_12030 [Methylobacter sp.]